MTKQFRKMVAIEPTKLLPEWNEKLKAYATESIFYSDIPQDSQEIIRRIGDADCIMLSFSSEINQEVLEACPQIRYIGMCCSLYAPENANVDILTAEKMGIAVTGVRDYGDEGVKEYVISELVGLLQGNGPAMWKNDATELTGLKVGILGMGTLGSLLAETFRFFNSEVYYYSRTRKIELEEKYDINYLELQQLLPTVDILITSLSKNTVLLKEQEFQLFGNEKILFNVSLTPSHDDGAVKQWLAQPGNFVLGDTAASVGETITELDNVFVSNRNAGMTSLAKERLAKKVILNIEGYLAD
ncbi:NAD(P)-dependent oxidoreductase [Enterococcus alishanensis]|uniref:Dihydrofolate reductase n=1 Tax=Enterococcus alishanensis TaxID=1303817 RepID=A0ABS6T9R3_9ENTE|nr:NAD(P)-dependent oxidoreductase [Enterococcus alishanensis]MBV7389642.1 dihydrofolate reductase [Enterococcus alishanensis]